MRDGPGPFLTFLNEIPAVSGDPERLTIADVQDHFGRRSFGPFLLLSALPVVTPLVNIPGVAATMGMVIFLTSVQILLGRSTIWLPDFIRRRSMSRDRIRRVIEFARPVSRQIDRLVRRRLDVMIQSPFIYVVALICALLGLLMPFLEFIPATSAVPAVPVAAFGLGITMHDGAFVIIGFIALLAMVGVAITLGSAAT